MVNVWSSQECGMEVGEESAKGRETRLDVVKRRSCATFSPPRHAAQWHRALNSGRPAPHFRSSVKKARTIFEGYHW